MNMFLTKRTTKKGVTYWYIVDRSVKPDRWKATGVRVPDEPETSKDYQKSIALAGRKIKEYQDSLLEPQLRKVSLKKFRREYFKDYHKGHGTKELERRAFNDLLAFTGDINAEDITPEILARFKSRLEGRLSSSSINIWFRCLRTMFGTAVGKNIKENPFSGRVPVASRRRISYLTVEQIGTIVTELDKEMSMVRNLFLFYLYTGARRSEALNLTWNQIDWEQKLIIIERPKVKDFGGLPIHSKLLVILESMKQDRVCDLVFHNNGRPFRPDYLTKRFKKIMRRVGINDVKSVHGLRHTFATQFLAAGKEIHQAQVLLGHKYVTTTEMYNHVKAADMASDIEALQF